MNYRTALFSFAVFATAGVAGAQTAALSRAATDSMHGMSNGSMKGESMHSMSHESMQGGGMNMMGTMIGKDPAGSCASMMNKVAANPVLHQKMNGMMHDAMSGKK